MALHHQGQAEAHSAREDRLREIEIAFDIQSNELATMKRERDATALAAQARACAWAAAHPSSSSGEGNHFQEPSSGGSAGRLAQPGRLESLAHLQDSVGYVKGAPSEPTTTCETAGGHGGSESSASDNRFLFPIDLTSRNQDKSLSRPLSPVNSERTAATEQSGPRHISLTTTQTITAPTKTVQGDNRKSSPDRPGASSSSKDHANRKGDKKDKKDKKKKDDDDDDDKDKDEGRSKRNSTGQPGGGKKDPDDSDDSDGSKGHIPPPPPSGALGPPPVTLSFLPLSGELGPSNPALRLCGGGGGGRLEIEPAHFRAERPACRDNFNCHFPGSVLLPARLLRGRAPLPSSASQRGQRRQRRWRRPPP